jgi:hypothetical protein
MCAAQPGIGNMTLERFEELYERYGDGALDPREIAEFKSALRDPVLARKLVEWSMFESVIHDELRLAEEEDQAKASVTRPVSAIRQAVSSGRSSKVMRSVSTRHSARASARKPVTYWGWGLAATIMLMALAGYYKFAALQPLNEVSIAQLAEAADIAVKRPGQGKFVASQNLGIRDGDVLIVGATGKAVFNYPDQTRIELMAGSEVTVRVRDDSKRLVLKQGSLNATVSKQPAGKPMTISTQESEATVLGTELTVQALDKATQLAVKSGQVKLQRTDDGQSVEIASGQFVMASKGTILTTKALPASPRLLEDYEENPMQRWKSFVGDPKISKIWVKAVQGKLGKTALEMNFNVSGGDGGGAYFVLPSLQDWSGYDGVRLWVRGQRSMTVLNIEVFDNSPVPHPTRDNWERFIYEFSDDVEGWRQVSVPFSQFKRRDFQRDGAPNDGFTLTAVHGFGFMGSRGQGSFAVDQVELYRK